MKYVTCYFMRLRYDILHVTVVKLSYFHVCIKFYFRKHFGKIIYCIPFLYPILVTSVHWSEKCLVFLKGFPTPMIWQLTFPREISSSAQ